MATNEIGEKVYYTDSAAKVTNVRITCNHINVPVSKVESVNVNFRSEIFCLSISILLICSTPFLFVHLLPPAVKMPMIVAAIIFMGASASWVYLVFKSYVELVVTVSHRQVVIMSANMMKKDYLCTIAHAIGEAIFDEKRYQQLKEQGEIGAPSLKANISDTMRLKFVLEDYEELKKAAEKVDKDNPPKKS